jgi:hypothetical protein
MVCPWKEVEREDQRALFVEPVDGGVVRGRQADEEVLGLDRDETGEQLLQTRSRILGGASSARSKVGQLDASGFDVHDSSSRG